MTLLARLTHLRFIYSSKDSDVLFANTKQGKDVNKRHKLINPAITFLLMITSFKRYPFFEILLNSYKRIT